METKLKNQCWGVIPAAGLGLRMGSDTPKQYLVVAGKTLLQHTLEKLLGWDFLQQIVVALHADDSKFADLPVANHPRLQRVVGGDQRSDSVLAALEALAGRAQADDWVLVHDAARPCINAADIARLCAVLADDPVGGLLAMPVSETVKRGDTQQRVIGSLDRSQLWLAQTPQMFRYGLLLDTLRESAERGISVTDEASAIEQAGLQPRLVVGNAANIKITRPEDIQFAELWLGQVEQG